jgi:hypothetical protein
MGDPTSWSVMPLMTIYSAQQCGVGRKLITCGDDALMLVPNKQAVMKYNSIMEGLGGQISLPKSFIHSRKGLFTEYPIYDGVRRSRYLLSHWVSPPGGSKGFVHWQNLPRAVLGGNTFNRRKNRSDHLWQYSKWYYTWVAAKQMGLPLGAPEQLGGISHPLFDPVPLRKRNIWLDKVNSLTRRDLCVRRGLSLVPPPVSRVCKERENYLWKFTEGMFGPNGTVEGEKLWAGIIQYEGQLDIFEGKDFSLKKTPSLMVAAERFFRRLGHNWSGVKGSYQRSLAELKRKADVKGSFELGYAGNPIGKGLSRHFGMSVRPPLLLPRDWETIDEKWKPFSGKREISP